VFDDLLSRLASWSVTAAATVSGLVLVVMGGAFFAANPATYRNAVIKLLPPAQHARAADVLADCGEGFRLWLLGQLLSMTIVGALAGLGTWAIGLPAPFALGLFAGLMEFVPVLGPVIGAIPSLLLPPLGAPALSYGRSPCLWRSSCWSPT
jgi:predicted PurR-regulated permease PerM